MAELVDAHDSGSCLSNGVEVRVFSSAPVIARVSECSHDWNTLKPDCYNKNDPKESQMRPTWKTIRNETKRDNSAESSRFFVFGDIVMSSK